MSFLEIGVIHAIPNLIFLAIGTWVIPSESIQWIGGGATAFCIGVGAFFEFLDWVLR